MNFTKIKPLMNRVLVKKLQQPTKTVGGILLPEKTNSQSKIGVVAEVGEGRQLHSGVLLKPTLKPGDYVLLPDYGGVKVPKNGNSEEEFFIFQEDDIIGVVNDNINNKI
jgi:chaperonin GroES